MSYQSYEVWASGIVYSLGELVTGSDGRVYRSLEHHLSAAANEPVSGVDTATYWASAPYVTNTWVTGTNYVIGMIVTGTDGKDWTCKRRHLSGTPTKPVTGVSYATYWAASNPSVPRARKPDGGIEMQDMVSNEGVRTKAPSYKSIQKKFPYKL